MSECNFASDYTLAYAVSDEEWKRLEYDVNVIPVVGDRYNAEKSRILIFKFI